MHKLDDSVNLFVPWLLDHYSQIQRSYCVWPFGLLDYGCAAKFDPFLFLDCARVEGVGAQSKEKGSNFAIWQPWFVLCRSTTASPTCATTPTTSATTSTGLASWPPASAPWPRSSSSTTASSGESGRWSEYEFFFGPKFLLYRDQLKYFS